VVVAPIQKLIDLLYPERCVACGRFGHSLCAACEASFATCETGPRCPNCSGRWDGDGNCPRCFGWDALDGAVVAVDMEGPARRVVHGLKYRHVDSLAVPMAARMTHLREVRPFDVAYAIPLHRSRRRRRGFNQAEVLLARLGWPPGPGTLERVRKTDTQVGLSLYERRSNVQGAFRYRGPELSGLAITLIDDVVTTGATANECARVLKDFGARTVHIVAFARANYEPTTEQAIDD